jgi:thiamine pyrophosphate-dependent acetolactate synthase large subunit-like protein
MALITGSEVLARAMKAQGVDTLFYLMGGPMMDVEAACIRDGMRLIDVRHEQAAAMMAVAWGRIAKRTGVCMSCSGPGATNLITGVASAWADAAPLVVISGSAAAAAGAAGRGIFQEVDQVALFKPITKWAARVLSPLHIPGMLATAFRQASSGRSGPAYLDVPGDVLYSSVDEALVTYPVPELSMSLARMSAEPSSIAAAVKLLAESRKPIVLSGSGVLWSEADQELRAFVESAGIPFFTSPQGRGVIPDDHALSFLSARSSAFAETDLILAVGTRANYVHSHLSPPRFRADAKLIQVDIDASEIGLGRPCNVGILGDARAVLQQLVAQAKGRLRPADYQPWVEHLREVHERKAAAMEKRMQDDSRRPMHPLRLCKEIRDFLDRDAILVVDGREILNFGRQSIPTFYPRHRLNSGTFGTMGVGLPYGIGAKLADPSKQVLVLHGDGSFGMNAMELDTAVRFGAAVVTVISLNGGWTAEEAGIAKAGRALAYTRYDKMAEALGCYGEYVEDPADIRPALERAFASGIPAVVNVKTDPFARSSTTSFSDYGAT